MALSNAVIFAAGVAVAVNAGKVPAALPVLRDDFGLDLLSASLLVSALQVCGMALGLFGGMIADRFGPRRVMRLGLLVSAGGGACGALAWDASLLLASRAVESVGFMLTVLPAPALFARGVPRERVRAVLGTWGAYMPLGIAFALVVTPLVCQAWGWRTFWWAGAGFAAAMAVAVGRAVAPDPPGRPEHRAMALVSDTLRSPGPWVLALAFGCYAAQWNGVVAFLPTLYASGGIALPLAGALTAVAVASNVLGNFAAGALLQRGVSRALPVAIGATAMAFGGWLCFGTEAPLAVRFAGVLVFSAVGGLIPGTLFASTVAYAPHPGAVATTGGLIQQMSTTGQVFAPPLLAALHAASGGWHHTGWATGALALCDLALALAMLRLDRVRRRPGVG